MGKKLLSGLPLFIFLVLVLTIAYFAFLRGPGPGPITPTTIAQSVVTPATVEASATNPSAPASPTSAPTTLSIPDTPTFTPSAASNQFEPPTATPQPLTDTPPPPTDTPAPTATLSPTPTPPEAVVVANELNLRAGPGVDYNAIGVLHQGDTLNIQGRIASNEWIQVNPDRLDTSGWVAASANLVQVNTKLDTVPIVETPPPPPPLTPTIPPPLYVAPTLTSPEDGHPTFGTFPPLEWSWEGHLAQDEYFEVRIWHESLTYHPSYGLVKQTIFDYNLGQGEKLEGKYFWSIIIVKDKDVRWKDWYRPDAWPYPVWEPDPAKNNNGIYLSEESESRYFVFTPNKGNNGGSGGSCPGCR